MFIFSWLLEGYDAREGESEKFSETQALITVLTGTKQESREMLSSLSTIILRLRIVVYSGDTRV